MSAFDRAWLALVGLSVGDAFGEQFFVDPDEAQTQIEERCLPASPWTYTDDTEMALSFVAVLRTHDGIEQDILAQSFAAHCDPQRGYGPATRGLLVRIREGEAWEVAAPDQDNLRERAWKNVWNCVKPLIIRKHSPMC